jgi:branched-chain amino acid transport system substrate-binding protein
VQAPGGGSDVDAMVGALEGWTFDAPKGSTTIRAADHAMLQPMFQAKLAAAGPGFTPTLVATVPAADTAPPQSAG